MSSSHVSCILKGCDAKYINHVVSMSLRGESEAIINYNIHNKAMTIVYEYDIKDCIKIMTKHGDMHDAYVRMQSDQELQIDVSDKLKFHRQIALMYVKQIIQAKIKAKYDALKFKRMLAYGRCSSTCSICLENITDDVQLTKCSHAFHRSCMTQWGRKSCPMCRADI